MTFGTKTYQRLAKRSRDLRDYAALSRVDDHMLRDIGVTRDEVHFQAQRTKLFL